MPNLAAFHGVENEEFACVHMILHVRNACPQVQMHSHPHNCFMGFMWFSISTGMMDLCVLMYEILASALRQWDRNFSGQISVSVAWYFLFEQVHALLLLK